MPRTGASLMAADDWRPVAGGERIVALDVLRGFALGGIVLMNIEGMAGPLLLSFTGVDPHWQGMDRLADALVYVLVQGKFYTLFSLLFGMGFATMATRAEAARRPFAGMWLRRSLVLLVIGLLHSVLLWPGDILASYALLALVLLPFEQAPRAALPWLGLLAYAVPSLLDLLGGAYGDWARAHPDQAGGWSAALATHAAQMEQLVQAQRQAYGSGGFLAATAQRWADTRLALGQLPVIGGQLFGMFLLGMWCVRRGVVAAPEHFPRLLAGLRWLALPAGLAAMLASLAMQPTLRWDEASLHGAAASALASLAGLLMCLGYAGWIAAGVQSPRWRVCLQWLAPAGRMALTNYLLQSLLCTTLFFGYGLGLFECVPRVWQIPFALALFAAQVMVSRWWLRRARFGPVEWLWRWATYLRRPPMWRPGGR